MIKTKEDLALERLKGTLLAEGYWQDVLEDFAIIETALNNYYKLLGENEETTKKLKALKVIKEKKVNVPSLITLFKSQTSYEDYEQLWNNDIRWQLTKNWDIQFSRKKLTQEEYDLLKEVLLCH